MKIYLFDRRGWGGFSRRRPKVKGGGGVLQESAPNVF
jgi:hypothetical protein